MEARCDPIHSQHIDLLQSQENRTVTMIDPMAEPLKEISTK
jgi:hypothetical protein